MEIDGRIVYKDFELAYPPPLNHRGIMSLEQLRQRQDLLTKEMKIGLKYIEVRIVHHHKLFVTIFGNDQELLLFPPLSILVQLGSSTPYP